MAMNSTPYSFPEAENLWSSVDFNCSPQSLFHHDHLKGVVDISASIKGDSGAHGSSDLLGLAMIFVMPFLTPVIIHYAVTLAWYYWQRSHKKIGQVPPVFPHYLPIIGHTINFLLDGPSLMTKVTKHHGKQTAVAIAIISEKLYFFTGQDNVVAAFKEKSLASPMYAYSVGLKYFFGMKENAVKTYRADNSGPFKTPIAGTNVAPHNRLDYLSHHVIYKGFSGSGMLQAFKRLDTQLQRRLQAEPVTAQWQSYDDLMHFYQTWVGSSMVQALYGPSILFQNPTFMDDLWQYNEAIPTLSKRIPWIFSPRSYAIQKKMLASITKWHEYARANFTTDSIAADGDFDPYWGSQMIRERQQVLLGADRQDHDSVAATDLGLIWTTVVNAVPSSMLACLEIFKDPVLLARVRQSIQPALESREEMQFDVKKLEASPILQSIYAEILRLHAQVYVARLSPHSDLLINEWKLPRNQISIIASYTAHRDVNVWNTKEGLYPLDTFWADRFLIYPDDPTSGPLCPEARIAQQAKDKASNDTASCTTPLTESGEPVFSMAGLDGSWIPYGGGYGICPGKTLARRIIILTFAMMVTSFDLEFVDLPEPMAMDTTTFGLGVQVPKEKLPFRLRRRTE